MNYIIYIILYLAISYALMRLGRRVAIGKWWHAWVPVMRELLVLKMAGKRWWWVFLMLIPIVNIWAVWVIWGRVANRIGRSRWWGRMMILPFVNVFSLLVMAFELHPRTWPPIVFSGPKRFIRKVMMDALLRRFLIRVVLGFLVMYFVIFWPAGTVYLWQGWLYLLLLFASAIFIGLYLLRRNRLLLERRMRMREKLGSQKLIVKFGAVSFILVFLIPGFDLRYGGLAVPTWLVLLADVIFLAGYWLFFRTLKENSYASRVIEVEEGQGIVSTGLYAFVRHPMYSAMLVIILSTPLCLGSFWGLLGGIPMIAVLVLRALEEEKFLSERLRGYKEYMQRVKYRLIPKVW